MISQLQIGYWCLLNRRGRAFRGYSLANILSEINKSINEQSMLVITDQQENILGVCVAEKKEKILFVRHILTVKSGEVKQMMSYFLRMFPSYTLEGHVEQRLRKFNNSQKLYKRL